MCRAVAAGGLGAAARSLAADARARAPPGRRLRSHLSWVVGVDIDQAAMSVAHGRLRDCYNDPPQPLRTKVAFSVSELWFPEGGDEGEETRAGALAPQTGRDAGGVAGRRHSEERGGASDGAAAELRRLTSSTAACHKQEQGMCRANPVGGVWAAARSHMGVDHRFPRGRRSRSRSSSPPLAELPQLTLQCRYRPSGHEREALPPQAAAATNQYDVLGQGALAPGGRGRGRGHRGGGAKGGRHRSAARARQSHEMQCNVTPRKVM